MEFVREIVRSNECPHFQILVHAHAGEHVLDLWHKADALLDDALEAAYTAMLPWHSKPSNVTLTSGSGGETDVFALPEDYWSVDGVLDEDSDKFLEEISMLPTKYVGEEQDSTSFMIYPDGYISMWPEPDDGDEFILYYRARWQMSTHENDVLDIPDHLLLAALYYAAGYVVIPEAESSAELRQYNTRADSGNPAQNPVGDRVLFYMKLFEIEITRQPSKERGRTS